MFHLNKWAGALSVICLFNASGVAAQSSFDQGSFGADTGGSVAQQPTPSAPPPDGFGGSFEDAGSTPAATGGDGFQPGSFAPDTPQNPPEQVVVNPPSPTPQPQPQPQPAPSRPTIDPQIAILETRDFGIPPTQQLRGGQFHSPTPTSIPGGQLVTTQSLANAINGNVPMIVVDVLGGQYALPNAYAAQAMSQGGNFNDHVQQQTAQWLGQVTRGQRDAPIVVYCSDPMCWLSYNAALRAIAAGYTNVYWYRGGISAWQQAGLPLQPAGF